MSYDPRIMLCRDGNPGHYHKFKITFECKMCNRKVKTEITKECRRAPRYNFYHPKEIKCKTCRGSVPGQWHCQRGYFYSSGEYYAPTKMPIKVVIENVDESV